MSGEGAPKTEAQQGTGCGDTTRAGTRMGLGSRVLRAVLTQRIILLVLLIVVALGWLFGLSASDYLLAPFDAQYASTALLNAVPLAMLALGELIVIVSGRGGIDLSLGSIVSLTGMVFGFAYGQWGLSLTLAILVAAVVGGLLGAVNGFLVAYIGFPPLITTLATFYAYQSLALVINDQQPISDGDIQSLYSITRDVEVPLVGGALPAIPLGVFTFLIPTAFVAWILLQRTTYGRRLYGIGTNDVAATWSGLNVAATRMAAYVLAGITAGLVSVYLCAQFASARPDAGSSGNGLALPAITIAILGGVAITGGIGRVAGVVLAALLITWINSGMLLYFEGNNGTQFQLAALGIVLIFAAVLNGVTARRYGGER